jgi:hypothetical protein
MKTTSAASANDTSREVRLSLVIRRGLVTTTATRKRRLDTRHEQAGFDEQGLRQQRIQPDGDQDGQRRWPARLTRLVTPDLMCPVCRRRVSEPLFILWGLSSRRLYVHIIDP